MQDIFNAENGDLARVGAKAFQADYGTKFPKATAKITDDLDVLLEFYNYPAEQWVHLRTTNPIESIFATVRHRTKVTKGPGSRAAGLAMAYKLIEAAQARWRAVNAPHLVALVRDGAVFHHGKHVERHRTRGHHGHLTISSTGLDYCSVVCPDPPVHGPAPSVDTLNEVIRSVPLLGARHHASQPALL